MQFAGGSEFWLFCWYARFIQVWCVVEGEEQVCCEVLRVASWMTSGGGWVAISGE